MQYNTCSYKWGVRVVKTWRPEKGQQSKVLATVVAWPDSSALMLLACMNRQLSKKLWVMVPNGFNPRKSIGAPRPSKRPNSV